MDQQWRDVAEFVGQRAKAGEAVIAPAPFKRVLPGVISFDSSESCEFPDFVILHKGQLSMLGRDRIKGMTAWLVPVFASDVFVVFGRGPSSSEVMNSLHLRDFQRRFLEAPRKVQAARHSDQAVRVSHYLGNDLALTRTIYGHKMFVNTRDISLTPHLLTDGTWEQSTTDVFRRLIKPGMNVVDIGANMGWYSLLAADLVGARGTVTSFEPNPTLSHLVFKSLMINGFKERSKVETMAVYSEPATLKFKSFEGLLASSGLFAGNELAAEYKDRLVEFDVEATSLDRYFDPAQRIDFLKVDAEGAETFVLQGAKRVLRENRELSMILEYAPALLAGNEKQLGAILAEEGFLPHSIDPDSTVAQTTWEELDKQDSRSVFDILLTRKHAV